MAQARSAGYGITISMLAMVIVPAALTLPYRASQL